MDNVLAGTIRDLVKKRNFPVINLYHVDGLIIIFPVNIQIKLDLIILV